MGGGRVKYALDRLRLESVRCRGIISVCILELCVLASKHVLKQALYEALNQDKKICAMGPDPTGNCSLLLGWGTDVLISLKRVPRRRAKGKLLQEKFRN